LKGLPLQPSFNTYNRALTSPAPLILVAMGCVGFMAHFSAPDFYHSLAACDDREETLRKYNRVTVAGYASVTVVTVLTLAAGFLTFGGNCDGIILNNYAVFDWGANVSRILAGVSVIGSYPFLMAACRSAALEIFGSPKKPVTRQRQVRTTGILLAIVTAIALVVKDAGFVVSFNGALMGSNIIYTLPALLFLKQSAADSNSSSSGGNKQRVERWFNRFLVGFGVVSSLLGAATSVMVSFFPQLLT
jgi:sodium-coupled neutral amino acid transporter 11